MSEDVMKVFRAAGAMKEGHFLLTSGLHSRIYWEKFRVLQCPSVTEKLCGMISKHFVDQRVDTVAGPTTGGIIIAFEVARQLGIRSMYAERAGDVRVFRRDFDISPGERVLVVDDILTTGSSIRQTISAVEVLGGLVIGVAVLVDRSDSGVAFGLPLFSCLRAPTATYAPDECPLCDARVPLVRPGGAGAHVSAG